MNEQEEKEKATTQGEEIAALEILGGFLTVLGCAMFVAVFCVAPQVEPTSLQTTLPESWDPVWVGRITNLLVAFILLSIGLGMFFHGRSVRRSPSRHDRGD